MERAGMPSIAVVNAATGIGSGRFAYRERLGRIEPGYLSRFIITRHPPTETVSNPRLGRWIVFDGEVFESGDPVEHAGL